MKKQSDEITEFLNGDESATSITTEDTWKAEFDAALKELSYEFTDGEICPDELRELNEKYFGNKSKYHN